jgi:hypothetical protein
VSGFSLSALLFILVAPVTLASLLLSQNGMTFCAYVGSGMRAHPKKRCGCYVAACGVDDRMVEEIGEILSEEDDYLCINSLKKSSLLDLIIEAKGYV